MKYAEVILPLPIDGTFTYALPEELEPMLSIGSRVYVQFGRKKYYTGIVESVHSRQPGYEVKPIVALLDTEPVVRPGQIKFWKWISDYYLCTIGEVYKAALPLGLKVESETYISLVEDFDPMNLDIPLTEKQATIYLHVESKGRMSLKELIEATGNERILPEINRMLALGALQIYECAVSHYRPVKRQDVRLTIERTDREKLNDFFDAVKRSQKQEGMLVAYLEMSGWLRSGKELSNVPKKDLIEKSGGSAAVFSSMVKKRIFEVYTTEINRFKSHGADSMSELASLSEAQNGAVVDIKRQMKEKQVILLHGVTGSGKTEIYSHLIDATLRQGHHVLYLVPEISLTSQLTDRLRKVFGNRLLVYHSKFSDSERVDIWKKLIGSIEPCVVLGVRSSVFLPFFRLGLVIVDEEHESSYKQYDPAPRYNARDAAIMLSSMFGAKTVLGSATPSVETYFKAKTGKYGLVELSERFAGATLPDVEIVDMRRQRKQKLNEGVLSAPLRQKINETMEARRQAIIFQNRRGFAPMMICSECGWVPRCQNCDVSMVYHKHIEQLKCHYCGASAQIPKVCPACGQNTIKAFGYGTERIAEEFEAQFPEVRVSRMDLDTTRNKNAYQEIINEFGSHRTDILIGTQMVSKGLDFENVNLVGVVNADTLLNFPDFRSDERAFNMLEQVAGRAGRRADKGMVIIQTTNPENQVLINVKNHDYFTHYEQQIADRQEHFYPPFSKVVNIYLRHRDARLLDSLAVDYAKLLISVFGQRVLGPEKPFVSKVANWHIQKIMLKIEANASMAKVREILRQLYIKIASDPRVKAAQIYYDVDPV